MKVWVEVCDGPSRSLLGRNGQRGVPSFRSVSHDGRLQNTAFIMTIRPIFFAIDINVRQFPLPIWLGEL